MSNEEANGASEHTGQQGHLRLVPPNERLSSKTGRPFPHTLIGKDANGDTHVFVTTDLSRAERQFRHAAAMLVDVKANWR